jgi:hypothetical protein
VYDRVLSASEVSQVANLYPYCAPGTYVDTASGTCKNCTAGTYSVIQGSVSCMTCAANTNASSGSSVCPCNFGYTGPHGGPCVACDVGKYKNTIGSVACTSCESGKYQPDNATVACLSCPAETFQNATGATVCATCPAGFKALPGTTVVEDCCGLNSKAEFDKSISCFSNPNFAMSCGATGWDSCTASAISVYQDNPGVYGPQKAVDGTTVGGYISKYIGGNSILWWQVNFLRQVTTKSITIYVSSNQPAWLSNFDIQLSNDGITFTNCATGQNAATTGLLISNHTCVGYGQFLRLSLSALAGSYLQLVEVQVYGDPPNCGIAWSCNTGYTGPYTGASKGQCSTCPAGTYKPTNGSAACTSCPANSNSSAGSLHLSSCSCNAGSTGLNGGPCALCAAGKVKNVTGTAACTTCPTNTYAVSGSLECSTCPANFTSLAEGRSFEDCCDPSTTPVPNIYWSLNSSTQAALSAYYAVRVSSTPLLGLRSMTGTVGVLCGTTVTCPIPATRAPTYVSSGGFNNQGYLTFRKNPTTQWMDTDEVPMSFQKGLTIVTVVRFLEYGGQSYNYKGAFFSMMPGSGSLLEVFLDDNYGRSPIQLCVGRIDAFYSFCTTVAGGIPLNQWLEVTFTYSGFISDSYTIKVTYSLPSGTQVVVSSRTGTNQYGLNQGPTIAQLPLLQNDIASRYALGYSAGGICQPQDFGQFCIRDIIDYGLCNRPDFDLAGFYLMPSVVPNADMELILQAIGNGSQIAYNTSSFCLCNAGFGGTGRSDCTSCAPGTYKEVVKSETCSLCSTNTYSTAVQALNGSTCLSCPNNSVSGRGRFDCDCIRGYEGDMFNCSACVPGKYKNVFGTSACLDCPANMEAKGFASVVCVSLPGYNGLGYALEDVGRSCGASLNGTCNITLSNGAVSTGTTADGALDASTSTFVSVTFNQNLARSCGTAGTAACVVSHEPALGGAASLANDGDINTQSLTGRGKQTANLRPYWRVDFGQRRNVFAVKIMSTVWQFLRDFKITVGDSLDTQSPANLVCADYLTGSGSGYMSYTCEDTVSGRYLYVINGPHWENNVSMSEVVVEAFNYTANPSLMLPWWAVDFEVERVVSGVVIRTQAANVLQVRVGHSTDPFQNAVCALNRSVVTGVSNNITCSGAMLGRYLFVIGTGNQVLVINDVRTLGAPVAACAQGTYKPLVGNTNCTACSASSASVTSAAYVSQCSCNAGYTGSWS